MLEKIKKFVLCTFAVFFYLYSVPTLAADPANTAPTVGDFNKEKLAPPPIEQPSLLKTPDEDAGTSSDIKIKVSQFNFTGNTVVTSAQLSQLTASFVGKELSYQELKDILRLISSFYQQQGLWARAILPEQDIQNGIVQIRVLEGRLGKIIIKTNDPVVNLNTDVVRKYVEHKMSKTTILNMRQLDDNIKNLNAVPGVRAVASLEAGQDVGETDVVVTLDNTKSFSGTVQADSYGSRSSGTTRGTVLVNADSLLKQGEQFTLQHVHTIGSDYHAAAGSFRIGYGGTRGTIRVSKIRYDLGDPFSSTNPTGNSQEISASIQQPLPTFGTTNLSSTFTVSESDYENKNNQGLNIQKKITRGIAAINFNRADTFYKGGVNYGSFTATVGDLDDSSTTSTTSGAAGSFSKAAVSLSRLQRLSDKNVIQTNLSGQYAFKNLDSAEQFSLGGPYGIRAYPNSEGQGDHGIMLNVELKHGFTPTFEGFAFYDWGQIQKHQNTYPTWNTGTDNTRIKNIYELQGTGIGVNWNITPALRLNWVFATTLGSNKGEDDNGLDNDGFTKDKRSYVSISSNF
jgi:hemolysin activation/secretion protein